MWHATGKNLKFNVKLKLELDDAAVKMGGKCMYPSCCEMQISQAKMNHAEATFEAKEPDLDDLMCTCYSF